MRLEPDSAPRDPAAARWTIHVDSLPPKAPRSVEVHVAVTEDGLSNQVSRGENRGRLLKHTSVVRVLQKIGEFENSPGARFEHGVELPLDPSWERENLRIAAFVQEPAVGRVLGAVSVPAVAP